MIRRAASHLGQDLFLNSRRGVTKNPAFAQAKNPYGLGSDFRLFIVGSALERGVID